MGKVIRVEDLVQGARAVAGVEILDITLDMMMEISKAQGVDFDNLSDDAKIIVETLADLSEGNYRASIKATPEGLVPFKMEKYMFEVHDEDILTEEELAAEEHDCDCSNCALALLCGKK